jgi:hypothetical protein
LKWDKQQMNLVKIAILEFHKKKVKMNINDNSDGLVSSHLPIETKMPLMIAEQNQTKQKSGWG